MGSRGLGVVVLAAGRGRRMGNTIPKPYISLRGKPILCYSLERFSKSPLVEEIVVVIHPQDQELFRSCVLKTHPFEKEIRMVFGGEHRQDSSWLGIQAVGCEWVAVHDGVRPFFSLSLLEAVFEAARVHRAAIPALPLQETVKYVDARNLVVEDANREALYVVQTPQCFERDLLKLSLQEAHKQQRYFTDEAGAALAMSGIRAKIVPGEAQNIKITTPWDLKLAEALLQAGLVA